MSLTMNCPICPNTPLTTKLLESELSAMTCPTCSGNFISTENYGHWHDSRTEAHASDQSTKEPLTLTSTEPAPKPKHCPNCNAPLFPYRVDQDLPFRIDRCSHCQGIWLDGNEWEILKSRGLAINLPRLFTDPYQHALQRAERKQLHETNLRARFGDADYDRAREFKAWLDTHPERPAIIAYLSAEEQ